MSRPTRRNFNSAFKDLRTAVSFCCWAIGLSLFAQAVVWSLLTFTDIRYRELEAAARPEQASAVMSAEEIRRTTVRETGDGQIDAEIAAVDVNRQFSRAEPILRAVTGISIAIGTLAAAALLPLIGLAVCVGAGSATPGVNIAVASFVWAVILVVLAMPLSQIFENVPFNGLFASYAAIASDVEISRGTAPPNEASVTDGGLLFYGRYCVLPLASVIAIAAIGLRFRAGVEAGLLPGESLRLDPELEKEVAKVKAGSLHSGGRVMGALESALKPGQPELKTATIRQVSTGESLPRLI
jgi:hypothetical protein